MSALLATANPHRIKASHRRRGKCTTAHRVYANNNPYRFTDPDGRATYALYPLTNQNVNTIVTDGQGGIRLHLGNTGGMGTVVHEGLVRHETSHKDDFPTNCENTCGIIQGAADGMGIGIVEPGEAASSEVRASNKEIDYLDGEKGKARNRDERPAIETRVQQMTEYRDSNQTIVDATPPPPPPPPPREPQTQPALYRGDQ